MPTGAPVATAHGNPSGFMVVEGFPTFLTIAGQTTIQLWETEVQPPAIDAGEPIDVTTMHNTAWKTKHSRFLKDLDNSTTQVGYDPNVLSTILSQVGIDNTFTITFPDGGTLAFYGYLQKFEPQALKDGEMPKANVVIVATNRDSSGAEFGPVYVAGVGTG